MSTAEEDETPPPVARTALESALTAGSTAEADPQEAAPKQDERPPPGVLSTIFIAWIIPVLRRGWRSAISIDDVPPLRRQHRAEDVWRRLLPLWQQEVAKGRAHASLVLAFWRLVRRDMVIGTVCSVFHGILNTAARPLVLWAIITGVSSGNMSSARALELIVAFTLVILLEAVCGVFSRHWLGDYVLTQFVAGATILLQSKAGRIAQTAHGTDASSSASALLGNDVIRVFENGRMVTWLPMSLTGVVFGIAVLLVFLGTSSLLGIAVMVLVMVLNVKLARWTKEAERANLEAADARVEGMEVLVKNANEIKLGSWESDVEKTLQRAREVECRHIKRFRNLYAFSMNCGRGAPVVGACCSLIAHSLLFGNTLTAADVFATVTIFQSLRLPMINIPTGFSTGYNVLVSIRRLEHFLLQEEVEGIVECTQPDALVGSAIVVNVDDADFAWPGCGVERGDNKCDTKVDRVAMTLSGVSFRVAAGELVAVTGLVGAGKSMLLNALLGELQMTRGKRWITKSVGFAPQQPVVISGTIRDNILFGRAADNALLKMALEQSALEHDLSRLPNGVDTEVGEHGTTLSGGQRARVGLARALFAQPALLLLDDPLAALDGTVAEHVITTLRSLSQGGTAVMLCVSQPHFARSCDRAISVCNGTVTLVKEHTALHYESLASGSNEKQDDRTTMVPPAAHGSSQQKLVSAEHRKVGARSSSVLGRFLRAMGLPYFVGCCILAGVAYAGMLLNDRWLVYWVQHQADLGSNGAYIFAGTTMFYTTAVVLVSTRFVEGSYRAGIGLHKAAVARLIRAPVSWFEATPSGRVISRFSSDLSQVDIWLGFMLDNNAQFTCTLTVLGVMVCYLVPVVAPFMLVGAALYAAQVVAVDRTNREAKRMANTSMSPLLTNFSEANTARVLTRTLGGGACEFFLRRQMQFVNTFNRANFFSSSLISFAMLTAQLISFVVSCVTATSIVLQQDNFLPEDAGLALTYSFLIPYFMGFFSFQISSIKASLACLERLLECTEVPQERPHQQPGDDALVSQPWPSTGGICFDEVCLRYRPGLDLSLESVSFTVEGGSTCGVVGRTGAGKSSLIVALFRNVELESGTIRIDNVDVSGLGLAVLRRTIAIIPQHPLLFKGSMRRNIDPWNNHGEKRVRGALDAIGLDWALDTDIGVNGDRLSSGERQLISLARAFLHDGRVVVMDEPTSNVDNDTDQLVQRVVRSQFKGRTVITIAHRIGTVIDCDRILVMGGGRVVEFGTPSDLLQYDTDVGTSFGGKGQFAAMVRRSVGDARTDGLRHGNTLPKSAKA